jgi:hypothetical protein
MVGLEAERLKKITGVVATAAISDDPPEGRSMITLRNTV